jgi:hypothetical protein
MEQQLPPTTDDVIRVIRQDCERQAERVQEQLGEVIGALRDRNHLGALGALVGVDEQIRDLLTILKLLARTPLGVRLEPEKSPKRASRKGSGAR